MMNIKKNYIPLALLEEVNPEKAAAIRAHHAAGKPLQWWSFAMDKWQEEGSGNILWGDTVYRAAPGSTDRKPKKPKPTPLVVRDWSMVPCDVMAVARDGDGEIVFLGRPETPQWVTGLVGFWSGDVLGRFRPGVLDFIDPGTCAPEASLVFRPGV